MLFWSQIRYHAMSGLQPSNAEKTAVTRMVLDADVSTLRTFLLVNVINAEAVPFHVKESLYDYLHLHRAFSPDTRPPEPEDKAHD